MTEDTVMFRQFRAFYISECVQIHEPYTEESIREDWNQMDEDGKKYMASESAWK